MEALKISPSPPARQKSLMWNQEAILSNYANLKGNNPNKQVPKLDHVMKEFKIILQLFVIVGGGKTWLSVVFIPFFSLTLKELIGSCKRLDRPRSETLYHVLSHVARGRRALVYSFSRHLTMMKCSDSVHKRIDTLSRLLPFLFEIVYEKMFRKDSTIFQRSNEVRRPRHHTPSITDCIKKLLTVEKDASLNHAKVHLESDVLIIGFHEMVALVSSSNCLSRTR